MTIFPVQSTQRLAVKLKPAAERMVKKRHPWVFEGGITKLSQLGKAGDLAIIYDNKKNKFLACGLYDPHSPIRVKVLQFHKPATIDKTWFATKIQAAYAKRAALLATDTNSYRLIYGENDGLPSLVADVYKHIVVVKLYSPIWFPYLNDLLPLLQDISQTQTIVLRLSRLLQQQPNALGLYDGQVLVGELDDEVVVFKEHGVQFSANVIHGHKTGYFLDHRHNRLKVGNLSINKTVLDVFSYAGGFSVHALAKGAAEVTSIDISAQALQMAVQNAALNPHTGQHHTLAIDAFKGLENLIQQQKHYDIVVIDPPSFAKKEIEVAGALNSYKRLAALGIQLVKKGGLLILASCTARIKAADFFSAVENSLKASGRPFQIQEKTYHDIDHPVEFPEGAYLKCAYYLIQA